MRKDLTAIITSCALVVGSCGGGGSSGGSPPSPPPPAPPPPSARLFTDPAPESLGVADVERVISLAVAEAQARSLPSTVAVVDRVGNVLGVFVMNGANLTLKIPDAPGGVAANTELQGASRCRSDRQGHLRRVSVERRQRLFDTHRQPDCPTAFPASAHDRRA
jgi:hypothetical protein